MANVHVENGKAEIICLDIQNLVDKEIKRRNNQHQISPSIYMVHDTLRNLCPSSFTPRAIAIGPLHREDEKLQVMERHKVIYLHDLFCRLTSPTKETTNECVHRVLAKIDRIKACYAGNMKTDNEFELAEMMVVDACFILELIYGLCSKDDKCEGDPIFENLVLNFDVTTDLVLLENQIPFFVLEDIFECTIGKLDPTASLTKLVLSFLKDMDPFGRWRESNKDGGDTKYDKDGADTKYDNKAEHVLSFRRDTKFDKDGTDTKYDKKDGADTKHDHILGLLQESYKPADAKSSELPSSTLHSAVELAWAGVKFMPNKTRNLPLDMEFKSSWSQCFFWFWDKPTFRMPVLQIEDSTESLLRNLIAYEQCSPQISNYVTSYAIAMDMLVDSKEDIVMLEAAKVLVNHLGSSKDAATMINSICKEVVLKDFSYNKQWGELESYYNGYWPKNIAWLRRTYFSSPWNFIALLAACFLFTLTVVQTYYTINQ